MTGSTNPYSLNRIQCEVCATDVSFSAAKQNATQEYVVCHSLVCQQIMSQKHIMSPGFFQRQADNQRKIVEARRTREAAEFRRIELLQEREEEENQRVRQLVRIQAPSVPEPTHLINIPSGLTRLATLSKERIEKYKAHLQRNIREAAQYSSSEDITDYVELKFRKRCNATEEKLNDNPQLRKISDQLCGLCKGGCCPLGGEHAFNSVITMRTFMDANPTMTEEEVLEAYLEKLEPETTEGSCINQTKTGCGLPREMRSDTCNGFYCQDIKSFHRDVSNQNLEFTQLITVQREHTLWGRVAAEANHDVVAAHLVDPENTKPINLNDGKPRKRLGWKVPFSSERE